MFAYLGTTGFMFNNELWPGSQHSQKEMSEFLIGCFDMVKQLKLKKAVLFA